MQLINHRFSNDEELTLFLKGLSIRSDQSVFIQLFSGIMEPLVIQSVLDTLASHLPSAHLIGATSAGEIDAGEIHLSSILLSLSLFDATEVSTYYFPTSDFAAGVQAAREVLTSRTKACIFLNEGYKSDSELFLDGFTSVSNHVMIAGGNACDDLSFEKTYVMHGTKIYDEGIVIAVLDSDILHVTNAYSFSWTPIGREMSVTKIEGTTLYEIDHRPIKELYREYLGSETIEQLPLSAVEFPLVKIEKNIPVARSLVGVNEDGGFIFAGHFNLGDKVRFAIGNTEEILTHAHDIQNTLQNTSIEATYIYSCVVRRLYLQDQINYELGLINDIAPSSGFCTYGEFYHSSSSNQLLNITTTTLSLSESTELTFTRSGSDTRTRRHSMLKALTHLLNVTQNECDRNLKELTHKTKTIEKQLRDEATGMKNRTALLEDIKAAKGVATIMLVNIDEFSSINNYYGHKIGDRLLEQFAMRLNAIFGYTFVYRIGGDEFAIICKSPTISDALRQSMMEILNDLERDHFRIDEHEIILNLSAGMASAGPLMVYNLAHIALKEARMNREKLVIFDEHSTLKTKIRNNLIMVKKIKSAIDNDRIVPYFQGIIDNKTRQIVKYEALVRLIDEEGNVLSPYAFLEHAKKAKLYSTLTQIMIQKTFALFEEISDIDFSINLTLHDIQNEETRTFLYRTLENSPAASRAVFEIVESEGIENFNEVSDFIHKLKSYGCKIAIDDFGTGYSNFSYLSKLPIDFIKIDGSLIKNINHDHDHLLTVESILFFAHKKNIETIAEFVEDESTFETLLRLGVTYTQGYLFSVPSPQLKRVPHE
jgi:c-di-GMP phosphodiesterase